jgi:hypothetical protein
MTLTDKEIRAIYESHGDNCYAFARAIEARVLEELRKQKPVAYVSIIDDDKPLSDIIDRELPTGTELYAAPIPPVTHCKLGCTTECKAKAHGCASECPALPWQPDAPLPTPSQQEPIHPTYGTLKSLMSEIANDIRQGYEVRIGLQGAMNWFSRQFNELKTRPDTEGSGK